MCRYSPPHTYSWHKYILYIGTQRRRGERNKSCDKRLAVPQRNSSVSLAYLRFMTRDVTHVIVCSTCTRDIYGLGAWCLWERERERAEQSARGEPARQYVRPPRLVLYLCMCISVLCVDTPAGRVWSSFYSAGSGEMPGSRFKVEESRHACSVLESCEGQRLRSLYFLLRDARWCTFSLVYLY